MQQLNPPSAAPGYVPDDPANPAVRHGPHQYVDFDIDALSGLQCPAHVMLDGGYRGPPGDPTVLNHETGDSVALRCDEFRGVLRWNIERDVQLPTAVSGFCSADNDCPEFSFLAHDPKIMQNEDGQPDRNKMFIAPGPPTTERLINNTAIFESVRDVSTDFRLDARYAWLLRYAARWSVARRIWELCAYNRPLLDHLAVGAWRVCDARLPRRERDDRLGSAEFRNAGF